MRPLPDLTVMEIEQPTATKLMNATWDRITAGRKNLGRQYSTDQNVWITGVPEGLQVVEAPLVVLDVFCDGLTVNTGKLIVLEPGSDKVLAEDSHFEECVHV